MATVPPLPTWTAGQRVTGALLQQMTTFCTFVANPPIAQLTQTVATSMASGAWTTVSFNSSIVDTYTGHNNAINNSRYTSQLAGYYLVSGVVAWVASSGNKWARIAKNGSAVTGSGGEASGSAADVSATLTKPILVSLNLGEFVELQGAQFTGGAINTALASETTSMLDVVWVHA
jgi:hypothetical protein